MVLTKVSAIFLLLATVSAVLLLAAMRDRDQEGQMGVYLLCLVVAVGLAFDRF